MQDMLLKFLACRDVGAVLIEEFKGLKLYWVGVAAAGGCYLMQGGGRLEASFPWALSWLQTELNESNFSQKWVNYRFG